MNGTLPGGASRLRWALGCAVALLLGVHAALAVSSLWEKSVAVDELTHLSAGLAMIRTGRVWLNPQHPPLVKLLAGAAAATLHPRLPLESDAYRRGEEWEFGAQTLFASGNDSMALLRRGRLPTVALSMIGGLAVFLWGRARFGDGPALLALGLYCFCPTILAHACWVTMDVPVAALGSLAVFLWWRATRRGDRWALVACGLAFGLALAAKFSALILAPAMFVAELVASGPASGWLTRLRRWAVLLTLATVVVTCVYGLDGGPLRYARDLRLIYADTGAGPYNYLHGEFRSGRFPQYFLEAMAVKTALPGLLAMACGLLFAALRRAEWREDLYLWIPAVLWIAVHSAAANDIGVRYVLLAYPLLFVLAGAPARRLLQSAPRAGACFLVALGLAQASEAAVAHPDYLAYFNQLAGGPAAGPFWLDDSNLDWGQELYRLPAWLRAHGVERVRLLYFGSGDPPSYGVALADDPHPDWRGTPRPGDYVISAHILVYGLLEAKTRGTHTDWLLRYRPVDVLGGSLYLYHFPPPS